VALASTRTRRSEAQERAKDVVTQSTEMEIVMPVPNRGFRIVYEDGTEIDGYSSEKEAQEQVDYELSEKEYDPDEYKKGWVAPVENKAMATWINRTETPNVKWTCEATTRTVWALRKGEFCHFPEFSSRGFTAHGPAIMIREMGPMCANYTEKDINDPDFWTWMEDLITRTRNRTGTPEPMPEMTVTREDGPRHTRAQYEADWKHTRTGEHEDEDGNVLAFPDPRETN
jgi:hypothetical protein